MRKGLALLGLWLGSTVAAGCASSGVRPGTGDIAFRLRWAGSADLDLRVQDPEGHDLSFIDRNCEGGGTLDVDCNATPEEICRQPIENVYWPPGMAPDGSYRFKVVFFNAHEGVTTADYGLQVLLGERVVERYTGHLTLEVGESEVFEYLFRRSSS